MKHWKEHFIFYDTFQMNYPKYISMLNFHKNVLKKCKLILDSDAGTGNLSLKYLENGKKVIALDNDDKALERLKEKCKKYLKNLKIIKHDLSEKLPFLDRFFDGIASCFTIPFISDIDFYLSENYRILKQGGKFSISLALPKKGLMKYIFNSWEKIAIKKGILPKYKKEMDILWKTSQKNEKHITKKNIGEMDLISLLKKNNFKNIETHKNSYDNFVAFISCER